MYDGVRFVESMVQNMPDFNIAKAWLRNGAIGLELLSVDSPMSIPPLGAASRKNQRADANSEIRQNLLNLT